MDEDRDYIKRFKTEHVRTPSIYGPQVNVKDVMQEYVEICDIFYSHAMDWIETETVTYGSCKHICGKVLVVGWRQIKYGFLKVQNVLLI